MHPPPLRAPREETRGRLELWRMKVAEALDNGDLTEPPPGYIRPGEEAAAQAGQSSKKGGYDSDEGDESSEGDSASEGASGGKCWGGARILNQPIQPPNPTNR
jgi:hypothetical protein